MANCGKSNISAIDNANKKSKSSKVFGSKKSTNASSNITPLPSISKISSFASQLKPDEFAMRSLNKYRNFMSAPECDCGCGGKGRVILKTSDDVHDFCGAVLSDNDCCECAIFLVYNDGMQEIVHKHLDWDDEEEDEVVCISVLSPKNKKILTDVDFFAQFDASFNLHCYGLMVERDNHDWEICE